MTLILQGTDNSVSSPAVQGGTAGTTTGVYYPSTNQIALATNGTLGLIQDANRNIGLGITPNSSWNTFSVIEPGYSGNSFFGQSGASQVGLGTNAYYSSGWKYANTAVASLYYQLSGSHTFAGAASGTATNAVTFTTLLAFSRGNTLALEGASQQAGTGITFPASQSASSNANTLDDYEEGTFSFNPFFITGQSGSFTNGRNTGYYIKIGKVVHIQGWVTWSALPASGTTFAINLPFSSISGDDPRGGFAITYSDGFVATGYQIAARTENAASYCVLNRSTSTSLAVNSAFNQGDLSTSSGFMISGSYIANA